MAGAAKQIRRPDRHGRGRPSQASTAIALLMLTIAAAAGGALFGLQLQALIERSDSQVNAAREVDLLETGPVSALPDDAAAIRNLPPVITNLAGPQRAWVRIESSIVLAGEPSDDDDVLAARIAEDITAFVQTVSAADIEGASGFQNLREDLNDRVRVRSGGRARDLVIHGFVVE